MPYTPPSQHSPAASKPSSPALSRSQSYLKPPTQGQESFSGHPGLPRSTGSSSYLSRHRRSPSINKNDDPTNQNSTMSNGDSATSGGEGRKLDPHGSLRQSPPPVNNSLIPTGATISPPDSSHNSSDDEDADRGRARDLENLAELHAAIRFIEQRKEGSPRRGDEDDDQRRARLALDLSIPHLDKSLSTPNNTAESSRPPLSREARKISHSRSSTDSNIVLDLGRPAPPSPGFKQDTSEEDEDSDEHASKPPMVRKKSGELVRPALRPSSGKRRPSSMPGTPTYSKAVHFDSHLEHVRHFLQVDKPLAVSAGSSPVETYESEVEFPFGPDESGRPRGPAYEWEIRLSNFPTETESRNELPIQVERVFLSADNKNLVGTISVQNLSFQKHVVARFTLDYWKTTSEVVADFNHDVRRRIIDGRDRFNFSIKLADLAHLENKTMFFCVRYNVNGVEYWDNNNSMNYQVDFTKKPKQAAVTKNNLSALGARPLNALPRSRPSPPTSSGNRKLVTATSFDDFTNGIDSYSTFHRSPTSLIGEAPIKLKSPRPRAQIVPDAPTRRTKVHGQAFGNRYDFGASLSAAIQSASAILGDQSGLAPRQDTKQSSREVPMTKSTEAVAAALAKPSGVAKAPLVAAQPSKPAALVSGKPPLSSQSYQELVDKYCFFGSAKTSPQLTKTTLNMVDGANDDASVSDFSVGSAKSDTSGSSTPTPPRSCSPSSQESPVRRISPHLSRSTSPIPRTGQGLVARTASPVSFGYPYHQNSQSGFFSDSLTPTPIQG